MKVTIIQISSEKLAHELILTSDVLSEDRLKYYAALFTDHHQQHPILLEILKKALEAGPISIAFLDRSLVKKHSTVFSCSYPQAHNSWNPHTRTISFHFDTINSNVILYAMLSNIFQALNYSVSNGFPGDYEKLDNLLRSHRVNLKAHFGIPHLKWVFQKALIDAEIAQLNVDSMFPQSNATHSKQSKTDHEHAVSLESVPTSIKLKRVNFGSQTTHILSSSSSTTAAALSDDTADDSVIVEAPELLEPGEESVRALQKRRRDFFKDTIPGTVLTKTDLDTVLEPREKEMRTQLLTRMTSLTLLSNYEILLLSQEELMERSKIAASNIETFCSPQTPFIEVALQALNELLINLHKKRAHSPMAKYKFKALSIPKQNGSAAQPTSDNSPVLLNRFKDFTTTVMSAANAGAHAPTSTPDNSPRGVNPITPGFTAVASTNGLSTAASTSTSVASSAIPNAAAKPATNPVMAAPVIIPTVENGFGFLSPRTALQQS